MSFLTQYFFLPESQVLVSGAKHSLVLDFKDRKIYCANSSAKRLIELGEQGLRVAEAIEKINPELESADALSFLKELSDQGLILLSADPKPLGSEFEKLSTPKLDFLWIEVTSYCNLRCIHCYADAKNDADKAKHPLDLSMEELKRIIDEAAALNCQKLQITGGEPTLRADIKELIEHAKARGFQFIEIFTNGTLFTEPMVKFLAEERIHVAISIYSYKEKTHDSITGFFGSFDRTLNSLKLLLAYGVPTRCAIIAMKQNEDDLDGTCYFLSKLGVLYRSPDPIRPSGRGRKTDNWTQRYGSNFMRTHPSFLINLETYKRNRLWNSCWFGKVAVTSAGDVMPCIFARDQVAGNIKRQNLRDIVLGENIQRLWSLNSDKVEVCRDCEYRYLCNDCRPWAYGVTGNIQAKSPRCTYNPYTGE